MDYERELDGLDVKIAKALGWTGAHRGSEDQWVRRSPFTPEGHVRAVAPFSSNLEAAWGIVTHLWATRHLFVGITGGGDHYRVEFAEAPDSARPVGSGSGQTPAEAICRAALAALANQEDR
jgi:Phage ABA sandwich domain